MTYESEIEFTLDTICPWTYIAYLRLARALSSFRTANPSAPVTFSLKFLPYQLYPEAGQEGENRYEWYKRVKYAGSEEKMGMFVGYMGALGRGEGVKIELGKGIDDEDGGGGITANTFHAHRILGWVQENKGEEAASRCLECTLFLSFHLGFFSSRHAVDLVVI